MDIRNKKLSEDEFFKERQEVLAQWPTGKDVDLEEAIAFHKSLPSHKVWVNKMKYAKEHGETCAITASCPLPMKYSSFTEARSWRERRKRARSLIMKPW